LKVIRGGGSVGVVEVMWLINSTSIHDDQWSFAASRHEFVSTSGVVVFNASQTSVNLTLSLVNDVTPSLETSYQLMITNASQVTTTSIFLSIASD